MEHRSVGELRRLADVHGEVRPLASRMERLERWAARLAADPGRRLRSLGEIEFVTRAERPLMRADNSPLTIAFEDPLMRAAGLESDRLGDAMTFFSLTEGQAHRLLCSCMNGWSMEAGTTAHQIERLARPSLAVRFAPVAVGAAIALPALAYFVM